MKVKVLACIHEFGIIDKFSKRLKKFEKYQPEKYNCISIDEDYIFSIAEKINDISMINPSLNEECYGLCYYGVTIIPESSLEKFKNILVSENNDSYKQLIFLVNRAITEHKNIIHYGV